MSLNDAVDQFVAPMRRRFTVPQGMNQNDFLQDLADTLSRFTAAQLTSAANWFRDNREQRAFPTIAECKAVVARQPTEAVYRQVQEIEGREARRRQDELIERRRRLDAYRLCRSPLGRQADHEGWLVALIEFCADYQRLPVHGEIRDVMAKAERNEKALRDLHPGEPPAPEATSRVKDEHKARLALFRQLKELRGVMLGRAHHEVFEYVPQMMAAE